MLVDLCTSALVSFLWFLLRHESPPPSARFSSEFIRRPLMNFISFVAGGGLSSWTGGLGASRLFRGRSPDLVVAVLGVEADEAWVEADKAGPNP